MVGGEGGGLHLENLCSGKLETPKIFFLGGQLLYLTPSQNN